jgi:hypothetical protein
LWCFCGEFVVNLWCRKARCGEGRKFATF